jgi:hypothetical protein
LMNSNRLICLSKVRPYLICMLKVLLQRPSIKLKWLRL